MTAVEIGPDLKHATAFVMPLGGKNADVFLEALNRSTGYIRTELATRMDLRYIPKITFKIDHSFDEAERIENACCAMKKCSGILRKKMMSKRENYCGDQADGCGEMAALL